jgi:tetratricopeptide (TPR) repeat protein
MRKLFATGLIVLISMLHCYADANYKYQWQKGNDFYNLKQYDSASFYFEQIAALKPQNAEVYYNLGNAYYKLNKIPQAVLNYERALRINPDYKEARDNLSLTQIRINNHIPATSDIFFITWWQALTHPNKAAAWSVFALVTFVIIIAILLAPKLQKNKGFSLPAQVPGILAFICACFLVLSFFASEKVNEHSSGVVMQNDAPLMNNEQKGKPLILVPEGTTVKIKNERAPWIEVTLPDGRSGWMQQNLIDRI